MERTKAPITISESASASSYRWTGGCMSLEADPAWVSDPAGLTTAGPGERRSTAPLYRWLRAVRPWSGSNTAETPLDRLVRTHRGAHPRPDVALLNHSFAVADRLHDGQVRRSGEKYISHPLA